MAQQRARAADPEKYVASLFGDDAPAILKALRSGQGQARLDAARRLDEKASSAGRIIASLTGVSVFTVSRWRSRGFQIIGWGGRKADTRSPAAKLSEAIGDAASRLLPALRSGRGQARLDAAKEASARGASLRLIAAAAGLNQGAVMRWKRIGWTVKGRPYWAWKTERPCAFCERPFTPKRHQTKKQRCCSVSCAARLRVRDKNEKRTAP